MRRSNWIALALMTATAGAGAQTYNIPALQTPRIVDREYNFAAGSASGAGTSLVFQWREGAAPNFQFGLEGGLAAPSGGGVTRFLAGLALAYQATRSTTDFPFDIALTAGARGSVG